MRKMKSFLSLVVVLLLCTSLTACASEKNADGSNVPDAQLDGYVRDDDPGDVPYNPPPAQITIDEIGRES